MKINGLMSVFVWVAACTFAFSAVAEEQWEKVKDDDGIKVYVRPVIGSSLNEFRGESILDYNYMVINNTISDIPSLSSWMPELKTSKLIEKRSEHQAFIYQEMDAPWPVSNRDYVVETVMKEEPDKVTLSIKAVEHDKVPVKEDIVRVTDLEGEWLITKIEDQKSHVSYRIRSNPAGSLPTWLANSVAKDIPFETIKGLRRQIAKYKDKK